jgi:hypothetical protein
MQRHVPAGSALAIVFHRGMMVASIWVLIWLSLQPFAGYLDFPGEQIEWSRRTWYHILAFGAFMGGVCEPDQIWATPLAALGMSGLLWLRFSREERRRAIALAGCLWGAIYPLTLDWPNADRMSLGLFIGGLATAVQGVVQIAERFFVSNATQQ